MRGQEGPVQCSHMASVFPSFLLLSERCLWRDELVRFSGLFTSGIGVHQRVQVFPWNHLQIIVIHSWTIYFALDRWLKQWVTLGRSADQSYTMHALDTCRVAPGLKVGVQSAPSLNAFLQMLMSYHLWNDNMSGVLDILVLRPQDTKLHVFLILCMQSAWANHFARRMWFGVVQDELSCTHIENLFCLNGWKLDSAHTTCSDLDLRQAFWFKATCLSPALRTVTLSSIALTCLHKRRWRYWEVRTTWKEALSESPLTMSSGLLSKLSRRGF